MQSGVHALGLAVEELGVNPISRKLNSSAYPLRVACRTPCFSPLPLYEQNTEDSKDFPGIPTSYTISVWVKKSLDGVNTNRLANS